MKEIKEKQALWLAQKEIRRKYPKDAREALQWLRKTYWPTVPFPDRQTLLLEDYREVRGTLYHTYYATHPVKYVVLRKLKPTSIKACIRGDEPFPWYHVGKILVPEKILDHFIVGITRLNNLHKLGQEHRFLHKNVYVLNGKKDGIFFSVSAYKGTPYYKVASVFYKAGKVHFTRSQMSIPYALADDLLPKYQKAFETAREAMRQEPEVDDTPLSLPIDEVVEVDVDLEGNDDLEV